MKKNTIRLLVEVSIIIVIFVCFLIINEQINLKKKSYFFFQEDDSHYAHQIDSMSLDDDYFTLEGWFFQLKKYQNLECTTDEDDELCVLLYDLNGKTTDAEEASEKNYGLLMTIEEKKRIDVDAYFQCEYDYSNCGFLAKIPSREIDVINGEYEIVIKPNGKGTDGIHSYAYIDRGKLVYYNPKEKFDLDVKDSGLEQIVEDGVCVYSNHEAEICIYQYDKKLYWIAGPRYPFSENGNTYIQYQIETTQFDRLPKDRIENGWFWSNISDNFENNEITNDVNCAGYRVSVRDIPKEYAITRITSGCFEGDNVVWLGMFRPLYMFF